MQKFQSKACINVSQNIRIRWSFPVYNLNCPSLGIFSDTGKLYISAEVATGARCCSSSSCNQNTFIFRFNLINNNLKMRSYWQQQVRIYHPLQIHNRQRYLKVNSHLYTLKCKSYHVWQRCLQFF